MMNKPEKWDTAKYPIFFVPIPTLFRDTHHVSHFNHHASPFTHHSSPFTHHSSHFTHHLSRFTHYSKQKAPVNL